MVKHASLLEQKEGSLGSWIISWLSHSMVRPGDIGSTWVIVWSKLVIDSERALHLRVNVGPTALFTCLNCSFLFLYIVSCQRKKGYGRVSRYGNAWHSERCCG